MTTPRLETAEQLLVTLLTGDSLERLRAHGEILREELGGLTVVDTACHDDHGDPIALPLSVLWRHLVRIDSPTVVAARGGIRVHTPDNTAFGDSEGLRGPARRFGGDT